MGSSLTGSCCVHPLSHTATDRTAAHCLKTDFLMARLQNGGWTHHPRGRADAPPARCPPANSRAEPAQLSPASITRLGPCDLEVRSTFSAVEMSSCSLRA